MARTDSQVHKGAALGQGRGCRCVHLNLASMSGDTGGEACGLCQPCGGHPLLVRKSSVGNPSLCCMSARYGVRREVRRARASLPLRVSRVTLSRGDCQSISYKIEILSEVVLGFLKNSSQLAQPLLFKQHTRMRRTLAPPTATRRPYRQHRSSCDGQREGSSDGGIQIVV